MGNIALNKPATASNEVMPYSPSRAVSGSTTPFSRWLTNKVPAWLCVDMKTPSWICGWSVSHLPVIPKIVNGWYARDYADCDFSLQGSNDNKNWRTLDSVSANYLSRVTRSIVPICYLYYRVYVTKGLYINPQIASIVELELYEAPPTSCLLFKLELSKGTLIPDFDKLKQDYTVAVSNETDKFTITPTAEHEKATIKVMGVNVASGTKSTSIPLKVGSNTIDIEITAQIGGGKTVHTINVTRAAAPASAYLLELTAQSGDSGIALSPTPFVKTTMGYTASVDHTVSSIRITPTAEDSSATIMVNGTAVISHQPSAPITLNEGINSIPVVVSAGDITQNYSVTITRAAAPAESAYLSGLTAQAGAKEIALSPSPFEKTTMGYSATIDANVVSLTVTPTAESSSAVITVNGSTVTNGQASAMIALVNGSNTIPVVVTASGVTQNYIITITRVDTSLSNLVLKAPPSSTALTPSPVFQSSILEYTLTAAGKNSISFTPTAPTTGAIITVDGTPVNSGSAITKQMNTGSNLILVLVTVGNVSTTYKVTVTK